jgi:FAD/FMN-containing dehydrogenase
VFVKTTGTLLGDYAQAASFETFLSKKQGNVANNDIARMQGIKAVFDPMNIMNPGKLLD